MAKDVLYITKRHGVFQYVRRVPDAVIKRPAEFDAFFGGKKLFRRSLNTKDQREALIRGAAMADDFKARVRQALDNRLLNVATLFRRPVTPTTLEKIRQSQRDSVTRRFEMHLVLSETDEDQQEELERIYELFEQDAEHIKNVLVSRAPTSDTRLNVAQIAADIVDFEKLDAPVGSTNRAFVIRSIREGQLEGYGHIGELMNGTRSVLASHESRQSRKSPLLSAVVGSHAMSVGSRRSRVEVLTAGREFIAFAGDAPLDEITKAQVRQFCGVQGSKLIGGKSRGSVQRPMSSANLKKQIGLLRASVNLASRRGLYDGNNPFAGVDVTAFTSPVSAVLMPEKRPFSLSELNLVFQYPWFTGCASPKQIHTPGTHRLTGMHYWVPLLALMTGCRAGEIGGLMLDEVRIDDPCPHIIIRDNIFRRTKGAYRRKVPLLDQLLELGFGSVVERARAQKQARLFEDWKAPRARATIDDPAWSNGSVIRAFNQTLIPNVLEGVLMRGARREVTFHSFRGAFKTLLLKQEYHIQTNYVHEVVGHEKFHLDKRYVKEISLEETYSAIHKCNYTGLILPHL